MKIIRIMTEFLKRSFGIVFEAWQNFNRDYGWAIASHVALSGLFALFPFLIFATSIAAFFELTQFAGTVVPLLFDAWPKEAGSVIVAEIQSILTVPRRDFLTIGGLLTLFFASNGVEALRVALNRSYRQEDTRSYILLRMQSFVFVIVAIIMLLCVTFLLVLLPLGWRIAESWWSFIGPYGETVWFWRLIITFVILLTALMVSHLYLPAGKRTIKNVMPGVIFTLIFWIIASVAFGAYLEQFADYVSTYAGLAGAMIGLLYLYLLGAIFIFGGEINAAVKSYSVKI